jgi:hypothetical protein
MHKLICVLAKEANNWRMEQKYIQQGLHDHPTMELSQNWKEVNKFLHVQKLAIHMTQM